VSSALLFEHREVAEVDWERSLPRLGRSSVLWIDLEKPDEHELQRLADVLDLESECVELPETPEFTDFVDHLRVTAAVPNGSKELSNVSCLVSERWVVTIHDRPLQVLERFRERATGSGATGELDGVEFLANLLELVLESYLDGVEEIEATVEEITRARCPATSSDWRTWWRSSSRPAGRSVGCDAR